MFFSMHLYYTNIIIIVENAITFCMNQIFIAIYIIILKIITFY